MNIEYEISRRLLQEGRSLNTIKSYCSQIKMLLKNTNTQGIEQLVKLPFSQVEKAIAVNGNASIHSIRRNVYSLVVSILNDKEINTPTEKKEVNIDKKEFVDKVNRFLNTEVGSMRSMLVAMCFQEKFPCSYNLENCKLMRDREAYEKEKEITETSLFYIPDYEMYIPKKNHIYSFKSASKWIDAYLRPQQLYLIETKDGKSMLNQAINDNIKKSFNTVLGKNIGIFDIKRIMNSKTEEVKEEEKKEDDLDIWVIQARKIVFASNDKQEILRNLRLITHALI